MVTAAGDTPGTYTVTIYDDVTGNGLTGDDPRTTVQLVISGAATNTTITPTTSSIATSTCQVYTVTGTDAGGHPAAGADAITITQTTNSPAPGTDPNLRFCDPTVATFPAPAVGAKAPVTAGTSTYTEASTVTLVNGTGKFGVASDYPGTVAVTAGTNSVGGSGATATLTVDAGNTTAGPSTANNDVASSLTVSPTPTNAIAGATVTETVTVKNASGDLLGGVQVSRIITGANPAAEATCGVTDQTGTVQCSYTATNKGTDTLTAFVEQDKNGANNKPGPNTGEPQASATINVAAALNAATLGSSCPGDVAGVSGTAGHGGTCNAPASQTSQTVTFTLTSTPAGGVAGTPAAGQTLTISETSGNGNKNYTLSSPGATVNTNGTLTATTDANGQVAVTVTHTAGTVENGTVTATFANGGTNISDTSAVDFVTPAPSTVTITPAAQTKAVGSTVTATITVKDQLGKPVGAGTNVNYTTTGANIGTPGANGTCTTDANGQCTITYTDKGPAETGAGTRTDTITATVVGVPGATGSATVTFVAGTATASNVTLAPGSTTNVPVTADPAAGKTVAPTTLTATVKDANGNLLQNDMVTFTSSGVGEFTDATGHPTGSGSFTAQTDVNGQAKAFVRSTTAGTQTVTATADGVASNQATVTYVNAQFVPVNPERLVDTRTNQGLVNSTSGPLAPNTVYFFSLSNTDVPQGQAAYVFNVTAVHPSGAGNLRIGPSCPGGSTQAPTTSLINYQANTDVANDVVVPNPFSCDQFAIYSAGSSTNVVIDLQGYYGQTTGYTGSTPTRAVDTRSGQGGHTGTIAANTSASFTLAGVGGIPAVGSAHPAKAVAINVTAIGPGGVGNLRVYPDGATVPTTSNINYIPGTDKAAFVVVQLPANGKIDVYSAGSAANVAIDVFGYYPDTSTVVTQTPVRVFDSRSGTGLKAGVPVDVPVTTPGATNGVPAGAQAVLISLTAIHAKSSTGIGNLRAYPTGTATPTVSNINYISSTTDVANFAIVPIGANGKITLYSAGSDIDATVDILGYVPATG